MCSAPSCEIDPAFRNSPTSTTTPVSAQAAAMLTPVRDSAARLSGMTCPHCHQPWAASQSITDHEICILRAAKRAGSPVREVPSLRTAEGAGRFLPFVAAGTLVVSFGVAIFARFFRAPRIDQTTDQQTDESDPYLANMVMVALRAEERRDAERFRAEMAEFGIGFPLHHVERF